jgi:hypothetical protein
VRPAGPIRASPPKWGGQRKPLRRFTQPQGRAFQCVRLKQLQPFLPPAGSPRLGCGAGMLPALPSGDCSAGTRLPLSPPLGERPKCPLVASLTVSRHAADTPNEQARGWRCRPCCATSVALRYLHHTQTDIRHWAQQQDLPLPPPHACRRQRQGSMRTEESHFCGSGALIKSGSCRSDFRVASPAHVTRRGVQHQCDVLWTFPLEEARRSSRASTLAPARAGRGGLPEQSSRCSRAAVGPRRWVHFTIRPAGSQRAPAGLISASDGVDSTAALRPVPRS